MTIQRINVGKRLSEAVIHGNTVYLAGEVPRGWEVVASRAPGIAASEYAEAGA